MIDSNQKSSEALKSEISGLLDFQDFSLAKVERSLDNRLELASWELVELFFAETDSIETANLSVIMSELDIDSANEFVNVIRSDGMVVNSTWKRNLGQDISDFGEDFGRYIDGIFSKGKFVSEKFELHPTYKSLVKWSYQPTKDGKYIIQIGVNSPEGSDVSDAVRKIIASMSEKRKSLLSIDIFINADNPFSFASDKQTSDEEKAMIQSVFKAAEGLVVEGKSDGRVISTEYIYSEREGSNLYKSLVVRLVKDKTLENEILRANLIRKIALFALGLGLLFLVLYFNANMITNPIRNLSEAAKSIGGGNLKRRVPVIGNKETQDLAQAFNQMASDLETSDAQIRFQKDKIEKAHKEIQSSIVYAKRIQTAILPPDRLVKEYLTNSFILYKPKDIVAGDFYWMERQDGKLLFAAADCTGHGVPGAMISVVCHSALNRSVREYGLTDPAKVLDKTKEIVLREFEKSDDEVQDGMDVALCSIQGKKLQFAGAQRPLYIVRDKKVIEIKGNKQPIGLYSKAEPFKCHDIDLQKGDTIYLFSDGLTDQFGGENGKKFLSSRLKELLISIQDQDIENHKDLIDKAFEEWRGKEDQIDDVCVIGMRI